MSTRSGGEAAGRRGRREDGAGGALGVLLLESQHISGQLNQGSSGKPESSLEMKIPIFNEETANLIAGGFFPPTSDILKKKPKGFWG